MSDGDGAASQRDQLQIGLHILITLGAFHKQGRRSPTPDQLKQTL